MARPKSFFQNETGFLVAPNDAAGLAAAVARLLADSQLRAQMGAAGRRLVDPAFRAETMVQQIAAVYEKLLEKQQAKVLRFNQRYGEAVTNLIVRPNTSGCD